MQWNIEVNQQEIITRSADALAELLALSAEQIKEGQGYPCVVDVRKVTEFSESPAAKLKELGVRYVHVPVTAATFSEQDMDCVRREFARRWGKLLVVSQGGQRAAFLALAHAARVQGWTLSESLDRCPGLADQADWKRHLEAYIERHHPAATPG